MLDTMLTFTFMIPACLIAVAITYGLDYLAKQEAEEKRISPVAASPGMSLTLSELETYNGTTNGKPILVSVLGNIYDVGTGAGLYGVGRQYHAFAGKDITCACAKFNKSAAALLNTKWLNLTREERALLKKFEEVFQTKYPCVGKVSDRENFGPCPEAEGAATQADAFSVVLGGKMFEKGHIFVDTKAPASPSSPHPATKGPPPF